MAWEETDVIVDGVRLHVYRRGSGPPLVLAHGASDNGLCWTPIAEELEEEFELIAYDARLHGQSDDGDSNGDLPYTVRGTDLIGAVEALGLTSVAAMGHSMGAGAVAVAIALRPDLFRAAVLEDPGWFDGEMPVRPNRDGVQTATALRQSMSDIDALTVDEVAALGQQQNPSWPASEFPPWALAKKQYRRRPSPPRPPWREVVAKFACPVLVLCGQPERGSIVSQDAEKAAPELCPGIQIVRLPTGHNVRREARDSFLTLTRNFLRSN